MHDNAKGCKSQSNFFALIILMWLSLQLDGEKKAMFKLAQQLSHAELHKLDTEVHNDRTVYAFSLCYAFVKPC